AHELTVVQVEIAELLVIADRRIVDDHRFELLDPLAAREHLESPAEKPRIRDDFDHDVDQRPDTTPHEDDPEPVGVRTAPDEMGNSKRLEQDAVGIEEKKHAGARI